MNYTKIYNNIIKNRQYNPISGYVEKHHIIPKSLGGTNDKNNIISLTAREHFICHYLLTKMFGFKSLEWYKMNRAFMMMKMSSSKQDRYFNSYLYESKRINFSIVQSKSQTGKGNSQFGTIWIYKDDQSIKIQKNLYPAYKMLGWLKGRKKLVNIVLIKQILKRYKKIKSKRLLVVQLTKQYEIYKENGFEKFVEITNYRYSKQNLVQRFQKYVKSFKPQNGKKR